MIPSYRAEAGPWAVLLKKGEWIDAARQGRVIPYKIYHPAEYSGEKMPVILWSHGFGGNRDGAAFISRFIASHGYTIVHMTHEGTDSSLWEGKPGHPWDILRETKVSRATSLARFRDVPFVLGQLPGWAAEHPDIGPFMDFDRLGMSGHSFGAMSTQVMAGMLIPDEEHRLISLREPRFKAGILYSPVPIRHLLKDEPDEEVYGPIAIPLLHMTGTDDDSPIEGFGYKERLAVQIHAGHPESYVHILQDGDHMVYNGTRGKLEKNPHREAHEQEILQVSLAFWDAQLKGDEKAQAWVEKQGLKAN